MSSRGLKIIIADTFTEEVFVENLLSNRNCAGQ